MRYRIPFLFAITVLVCSCGHSQNKPPKEAIKLNDSAFQIVNSVRFSMMGDSTVKIKKVRLAISLLDKALRIDTNYRIALFNKFEDEMMIHQTDSAKKTSQHIINISQGDGQIKVMIGIFYNNIGDSSKATTLYSQAIEDFNLQLTLLPANSKDYKKKKVGKAMALVLLGKDEEGHDIMNQLYDSETDPQFKAYLEDFRNLTKHDILFGKTTSTTIK